MKISHNWLQNYFEKPIPDANKLAELFTFHSFEIEGVEEVKDGKGDAVDSVIDAKVLPDRAHYCLSHKGVAGEISVLTGQPIWNLCGNLGGEQSGNLGIGKTSKIPTKIQESTNTKSSVAIENSINTKLPVTIQDQKFCRRYMGRIVENVSVGQAPEWMKKLLEAIGQRAIASIVDATNFCMFDVGQPLHAFDADKIKGSIVVRPATVGEKMVLLDGTEVTLTTDDSVIADDEGPLVIAGVKGGKRAEVNNSTKRLFIESANFDPTAVRRTSTKYNLRSESSKRYENEITPELASLGMNNVCALIKEMSLDAKFGPIVDVYPVKAKQTVIEFNPAYIEKRLGVKVPLDEAQEILERMRIEVSRKGPTFALAIPFNRLDLVIYEDIVEEVGRVYGYEHIKGILPPKTDELVEILPIYYLTEMIRNNLVIQGFSEVSLYSLVEKGDIETAKPLSKDKAFARKNLTDGMMACVEKNALNADLLGLQTIKVFEIGQVFSKDGERTVLSLGVAQVKKVKGVNSEQILVSALKTLKEDELIKSADSITNSKIITKGTYSVCEIDLEEVLKSVKIPDGASYKDLDFAPSSPNRYQKISPYPFIVRDIAVFVPETIQAENVWKSIDKGIIEAGAEELLVKHSLFDTFKKDEKVSYAFRMIFQSMERTLTDVETNTIMEKIYGVMKGNGWEVR